jgi:1-acyl-sn-glycerol-3-phosphate acyltransferase
MNTVLLLLFENLLRVAFGLYRTPKISTPCIVVSNHNTVLDVYVLSVLFPLKALPHVRTAAAADTYTRGFFAWFCRHTLNPIMVNRQPHKGDPLAEVRAAVAQGDSLVIFPEGTRGEPGVIEAFKPGVGEIARNFPQIPIYPCFIAGIERVWPRGATVPLPFNVEILVGDPYFADPQLHRREIARILEGKVRGLADRYEQARRGEIDFPDRQIGDAAPVARKC